MARKTTFFANGRLPGGGRSDFLVTDGRFARIGADLPRPNDADIVDLGGDLVLPGLVDGHMHLDKTLQGLPWTPHAAEPFRMSRIENDKRMLPSLPLGTKERARKLVERCMAHGTAHLRTHVDIHRETGLKPLEEILALREECEGRVTIQIVAFPQGGVTRAPGVIDLMDAAIGLGADLVGGLDPAEIDRDPAGQLDAIFALAERRGVGLDIHLHEPGELGLFDLEEICRRTKAHAMQGKVTVSHGFCLSMIAESKAQRAAEMMGEAGIMLATMGGSGTTVPPLMMLREAGVTVFAGNDDIRDTWSPYGTADMLERVSIIGWKCDLRHDALLDVAFELASTAGAKALGIENYGIVEGAPANFFTVAADGIPEAVGGHPPRKLVVHRGNVTFPSAH